MRGSTFEPHKIGDNASVSILVGTKVQAPVQSVPPKNVNETRFSNNFSKNGFLLFRKPCSVRFFRFRVLGRIFQNSRNVKVLFLLHDVI